MAKKKYKINRVEIVPRAQERFDEMYENIEEHYSSRVADKFVDDFNDKIEELKQNPEIYKYSDEKKILDELYLASMELFYTKSYLQQLYVLPLSLILA